MLYEFPSPNQVFTPTDIIALLCQDGFMSPNDWRPITGAAVCLAESGGDPLETGKAVWNPGAVTHLSVDIGIWQLNDYYNTVVDPYPTVLKISRAECFDPFRATQQTWQLINMERKGWNYNWNLWTAYKNGSYDKYVSAALGGMREYRDIMGLGLGVFG